MSFWKKKTLLVLTDMTTIYKDGDMKMKNLVGD